MGKKVSAAEAISHIKSGDRVIIPECCGLSLTLIEALIEDKNRLKDVEIVGGLQIEYKFLAEGLEDSFSYRTWQCHSPIRRMVKSGRVKYMPVKRSEAHSFFLSDGPFPIDVALIHVSPPDELGFCSLGVSPSIVFPVAKEAKLVIAEINEQMPRVLGDCFMHMSEIDYFVETSRPLLEQPPSKVGEKERAIGRYVAELIPDGATIEVGIGAIPEAILQFLGSKRDLKIFALGVDGIVDLVEQGAITKSIGSPDQCKVVIGEVLGTKRLFNFLHNNPMVKGETCPVFSKAIAGIEKFISIIGAIEVDLTGQVNAETTGGKPLSAVGGSSDFIQGALSSPGGKPIIVMTSTTPDEKQSRIVSQLYPGSVVTHSRQFVQYVATEYGIADLRGKSLQERAEALIAVAHPDFREELWKEFNKSL